MIAAPRSDRPGRSRPRPGLHVRLAAGLAVAATFLLPAIVAAHPLGNFTINHYAGLRIEPDRILLDVVIDQAEIPAFQARLRLDLDGDGELSDAEAETGRVSACRELGDALDLRVGGAPRALELTDAGLSFPPGAAGLPTMRTVCGFASMLDLPLEAGAEVVFADRSYAERLGWREIVVEGSGVTVVPSAADGRLRASSPSTRLTAYPADLLGQAIDDTEVAVVATPGGPTLPAFDVPDASPVAGPTVAAPIDPPTEVPATPTTVAAVPGGVAGTELPSVFRTADLTPIVLLVSILSAVGLGAVHALTPGHGKTLMAAYLVGTRGTPVHAAGLGLSVALSHTIGILALAGLVVGAQGVLPADLVVRTAPVVAAVSIVAIGAWMLLGEARRRRDATAATHHEAAAHEHAHADTHDERHGHDHHHHHGSAGHHHLASEGSTISWRSLFVLGLAGGLIPSASALLILLGSIAAGRPAFGFVLVVAFGLGMAMVMGAIGLALVVARERLDHVDASARLGRATAYLPLAASVFVLGFGLYLTAQAVNGSAF